MADDAEAVQDLVFDSMRAGYERGDLAKAMEPWGDDGKLVRCRGEKPGKYEYSLDRKRLEAVRRLIYSGLTVGANKLTFESPLVEIQGDKAELRVMTVVKFGDSDDNMQRHSEIYLLRRTASGWRIYECRSWPVEVRKGDKTIDYDSTGWKELDASVEAAEKEGDIPKLVEALRDARRHVEAHKASQKLTAREGAPAADWVSRGWLAAFAGDVNDATKAFREAVKLDPDARVPSAITGKARQSDPVGSDPPRDAPKKTE
jgi:hypothetical protein